MPPRDAKRSSVTTNHAFRRDSGVYGNTDARTGARLAFRDETREGIVVPAGPRRLACAILADAEYHEWNRTMRV